jgi:uncharacterized membrane protein
MTVFTLLAALVIAGVAMNTLSPEVLTTLVNGLAIFLLIEVVALRRRIRTLEEQLARTTPQPQSEPAATPSVAVPESVVVAAAVVGQPPPLPTAVAAVSPPQITPPVETAATFAPAAESRIATLIAPLLRWCTGGNPVLKIGIVVLFFGVAFLLKYAAQRDLIPIELRLAGVALAGLALLITGWRLRQSHRGYGLGLEGGAIGILYLVVFAAAKLYHLLPLPLALAMMVALVGLSCALAVMQEARGLAVSGSIGGFLAPVLMSTGSGSHVLLFSYYALLNSGILGIAWFMAWRELNLVGFVFTFGIATLWGASAYTPAHFATTEPFLVLFFLQYCLIAVLFAHRQPLQLRGFIDGPLVFGLPVLVGGLQAYLVHDFRYGMAVSALALGGWYIGLARLLWHRLAEEMRLLVEAFLALGVVFASLAIPLGLDPHWTTAAWALEGAAMVWVGVRQNRPHARLFGLLLQIGAAVFFVDGLEGPPNRLLLANRTFLGCGLIAAAALCSSFWLDRNQAQAKQWERLLPSVLLGWGLLWWYGGGFLDLEQHVAAGRLPAALLLYTCATTAGLGALVHWFGWQRMTAGLLLLWPVTLLVLVTEMVLRSGGPLLAGWGWLAWPLALGLQYGVLAHFEDRLSPRLLPLVHSLSLWLLLATLTVDLSCRVAHIDNLNPTWSLSCWGAIPTLLLYWLELQGDRLAWPVARFASTYHGLATDVVLLLLVGWILHSFGASGDPSPLPYIPLVNPLELIELAIVVLIGLRALRRPSASFPQGRIVMAALLLFAWLNVVVGRSVHFFADVPYHSTALFAAPELQASIAALWAVLALALTIWGASRELRRVWLAGAGLLGLVVLKLFFIDLAGTGTIGRIVSFLVVGLLMLVIGFFAPLPPHEPEEPSP